MSGKTKKKKFQWQQCLVFVLGIAVGAVCGVLMVQYIDATATVERTTGESLLQLALMFVGLYTAIFLQLIIHEAGHLVCGLLTGYRFSSFRIGSFMWIKEGDKLRLKRLKLAGTGGQCLMSPPELQDGVMPVVLYNLGGSLLNVLVGAFFLGLSFLLGDIPLLAIFLLIGAVVGFLFAIMNGVPLRLGTVDNDGYNALSLGKRKDALRAFWVQMKTNELLSKGLRLKDMPAEWFAVPDDEAMKNSMVAVMGVFACNRLMDEQRFADADALMAHLLEIDSAIVGLHRNLMICDRMYCALLDENRTAEAVELYTTEQKRFMQSMKKFPTVLRTEYVYALRAEHDLQKAAKAKAQFEKCAKTYPYAADIQAERELIQLAEAQASAQSKPE